MARKDWHRVLTRHSRLFTTSRCIRSSESKPATQAHAARVHASRQFLRDENDRALARAKGQMNTAIESLQNGFGSEILRMYRDTSSIQLDPNIPPYTVTYWSKRCVEIARDTEQLVEEAKHLQAHISDLEAEEYPADLRPSETNSWLENMSPAETEDEMMNIELQEQSSRNNLYKRIERVKSDLSQDEDSEEQDMSLPSRAWEARKESVASYTSDVPPAAQGSGASKEQGPMSSLQKQQAELERSIQR